MKAWIFLSFVVLSLVMVSATVFALYFFNLDEVHYDFTPKMLQELEELFEKSNGAEFVGYIDGDELLIIGYQGDLENSDFSIKATNVSIHSHPSGFCIPSEQDFAGDEKVICIYCGQSEVRCFLNE